MNGARFWGRIEVNRKNQRLHFWSQHAEVYTSQCGLEHNATRIVKCEEGVKCQNCLNYARASGQEKADQYEKFVKEREAMSANIPSRLATLMAQAPDKLDALIADEEGYGLPGTLPSRNNNPGDLRHSPHSSHDPAAPDAIGDIDTPQDGWTDLEEQLERYAARGLTLQQAIYE